MEIYSPSGPLPHIPDDLKVTVPQFIFECQHAARPERHADIPWLIDDVTGRRLSGNEVCLCHGYEIISKVVQLQNRTSGLANGLSIKYNIRELPIPRNWSTDMRISNFQ